MKIHYFVLLTVIISEGFCSILHKDESVVTVKQEAGPGGLWQTKLQWKAHWVRHWETRKIWIPVWKKVWGPVQVKEWIPVPRAPPTWEPPSTWAPPHK